MKKHFYFLLLAALLVPWAVNAQVTCETGNLITVSNADASTTTTSYIPGYSYYNYSYSEVIILAEDMYGIGTIKALQFKPASTDAGSYFTNCEIYLAHTSEADLSGGFIQDTNEFQLVWSGDMSYSTTDWQTIVFDSTFIYDGASNLVIAVRRNHGSWTSGSSFEAYTADAQLGRYIYQDSGPYTIGSISGGTSSNTVGWYKLLGCDDAVEITCARVKGVYADDITTTGATLHWVDTINGGATYTIYNMADTSIVASGISDTFYTITSFNANTIYSVAVMAECGDEDNSALSRTSFRTACDAISELPWEMNFDDEATGGSSETEFIPCFTRFENGSYHYPYVYATYARSGNCLYWYWYNSGSYGTKHLVALPPIDTTELPINTLQLRFWARTYSSSTSGTIQVGVLTDLENDESFVPLRTFNLSGENYVEYTVAFGDAPEGSKCMAVKYLVPSTNTQYVMIDDLTIEVQPACPPIIDLAVEGTTTGSALLSWGYLPGIPTAPESYVVSYINLDDSTATAVNATTDDPHYAINGLLPNTNYRFWVSPNCGTEDGMGEGDSIDFATINFGCAVIDQSSSFSDTIGDGTSTSTYLPSYSFYNYGYSQQIFTAAEIGHGGEISSLAFMMAAVSQQRTFEIYLGHVTESESSEFLAPDDLTLVYNGGHIQLTANEWTTFNFTTPFNYDGSRNLLVVFRDMTGDYESGNSSYVHDASSSASRYIYQDGSPYTPGAVSGGTSTSMRNNIILAGAQCAQVATCAAPAAMVSDVDVDQVTVTWVPGASEDQWDLYYRVLGDTVWEEAAAGVSTTSYTYTNLLPGLTYEFRVVNDCSEGIFDDVVIGTTLCAAEAPLPLTENFQTREYGPFSRSCWVTGSTELGTSYPLPYVISLQGDEENKLCLIYNGGYMVLPKVAGILSDLQISFKLTQGADNVRFLMGLVPDQQSPITSMIVLDTLTRSNIDTTTSTVNYSYVFDTVSDEYNNYCIAFWDAFNDNYTFLDDIEVDYVPACSPVTGISATTTTTDATISWDVDGANGTSYIVEYGPRGFARGTGATVNATSSPVTISGLSHSTNYDAYVYTECASMETTSNPSQVVQFTTQCDVVSTFPYVMNFENIMAPGSSAEDVQPNCWIAETTNGGTVPHVYYTSSTNYAPSPSYCYYMYNLAVAALPQMSVPLNTLQVSFHEYNGSPNYYGLIIGAVSSDTNGFAASFEPIDTLVFEDGVYQYDVVCYLTDYTGTGNRIAFKNYYNGTSTYSYHYIDNLVVSLAPTCIAPQRVQLTSLTNTSADLAWYISQASNYNIEYGPAGFVPGTGVTVTSASRSVSLAGLAPATTYDVRIVGVCSDSDHSDTTVFSFTTMRAAPVTTLPYFCDFSDSTIANAWELVNDDDNKWFVGSAAYNGTTDTMGLYISDDNGATNNYTATVTFSYAYRSFQLDSGIIYGIAFDWRAHGESNYDYLRAFLAPASGIMTAGKDPNGGTNSSSFSSAAAPAGWIDLGGKLNLQDNWQTIMEDAIEVNATGVYNLVFLWANDGSVVNQPPVAIDNVEVFVNTCPAPTSVNAVSASASSISVDWAGGAEASTWQVEYGPAGYTRGTGTIITTTTHPISVSGLNTLTPYDFYVRCICTDADTGRWSKKVTLSTALCDNYTLAQNFDDNDSIDESSYYLPLGTSNYNYGYTQTIIPASRLASLGGDITAIAFNPVDGTNGDYYTNITVYMANVSEEDLSSGFIVPSDSTYTFTKVIDSADFSYTDGGWQTHGFNTPFAWNGTSNLLVVVKRDHGTYSYGATFHAHNDSVARARYAYTDGAPYELDGSTTASSSYSYSATIIGDIRLISCGPSCTAPVNLTADTSSYNSLTFNWNDGDSAEAVLMAGYWDENAIATATSIVTTAHTATFTGLQPNEMYTVGVRTLCEESTSDWVTMTVHTADLPCEAPADVTVSATTFDGATVAWTAGTNATSWEVRVYNNTYDETYTTEQTTYT
ncbi:MAG: fibronectin type III domain-containing protein, partial [Prevotella sp.]|nr:fibronectin type III domain-containing protein [Prevotella sp.]